MSDRRALSFNAKTWAPPSVKCTIISTPQLPSATTSRTMMLCISHMEHWSSMRFVYLCWARRILSRMLALATSLSCSQYLSRSTKSSISCASCCLVKAVAALKHSSAVEISSANQPGTQCRHSLNGLLSSKSAAQQTHCHPRKLSRFGPLRKQHQTRLLHHEPRKKL